MADLTGIDSITQRDLERLRSAGIHSTDILIKKCATPVQRQVLATTFGFSEQDLLRWVSIADLFRIHGAGSQYVRLMVASGIDTVSQLTTITAEELLAKMAVANKQPVLVRQLPRLSTINEWITTATNLPRRVY